MFNNDMIVPAVVGVVGAALLVFGFARTGGTLIIVAALWALTSN